MRFFFYIHPTRPQAESLREEAARILIKNGCEYTENPESADFAISIGGDGTVVATNQLCSKPIIGINAGTLGYLPKIEPQDMEKALCAVIRGEYSLENRMMLTCTAPGVKHVNALNDIVLQKADQSVIRFTVTVDGVPLMRYTADGLIASTPTGSTGYSLSAGGPIVDPLSELIVLTPLAPHTLLSRSIILSAASRIALECENAAVISIDGNAYPISANSRFSIQKSTENAKFVTLSRESFVERLRKKLY